MILKKIFRWTTISAASIALLALPAVSFPAGSDEGSSPAYGPENSEAIGDESPPDTEQPYDEEATEPTPDYYDGGYSGYIYSPGCYGAGWWFGPYGWFYSYGRWCAPDWWFAPGFVWLDGSFFFGGHRHFRDRDRFFAFRHRFPGHRGFRDPGSFRGPRTAPMPGGGFRGQRTAPSPGGGFRGQGMSRGPGGGFRGIR